MDKIQLKGIACQVHLGVPAWERKKKQKIFIDVTMELDLSRPGQTDDVQDTVNYAEVEQRVRKLAEAGEFRLAEKMAETACSAILSLDPSIQSVYVAVHKKPKVMPKTQEVVVEVTRRKI